MESDLVFIDWLAFIYMLNIINHYPLLPSNSSGTTPNKLEVKLETAVP